MYVDPPYLISDASYNAHDGGWSEKDDIDLFCVLDTLTEHNVKWMMSNVLSHGGVDNVGLIQFSNRYNVLHLDVDYSSCVGTVKKEGFSDEVIIANYELKSVNGYKKNRLFGN